MDIAPVLVITWDRPKHLSKVLNSLRSVKPNKLYFSSDGPISGNLENRLKVEECRSEIASMVDWECDVYTRFCEKNLGCKYGVSSAIDWFFEHEDKGIIIEDDVVCDGSFFRYCTELLEYYSQSESVGCISANCFDIKDREHYNYSYYFSRFPHIWGWATWKRVWNKYQVEVEDFSVTHDLMVFYKLFGIRFALFWAWTMVQVKRGKIDTWDYQLFYAFISNSLYCICPSSELADNIGFDSDACHTKGGGSPLQRISPMRFPLSHPELIASNRAWDKAKFLRNYFPDVGERLRVKARIGRNISR